MKVSIGIHPLNTPIISQYYSSTYIVISSIMFSLVVSALAGVALAYDDNYSIDKSKRYVQFSGIAYCADPLVTQNNVDNWNCKMCSQFPNTTATTFYGGSVTDQIGYVAYDGDANEILMVFAGTDPLSLRNWIDDIDFIKTDYPYCDNGCQVHEGFYRTFNSVRDQAIQQLDAFAAQHPSASITVTGHSLGAALAALGTAELAHRGYKLTTPYTYGMPRVGDDLFQQWYKATTQGTFRVTHHKDPVPHLPLESMGFHHMPYEAFYNKKDFSDTKVCDFEGEDESCSNQYAVDANVMDHLDYMGLNFGADYLSAGCKI
jgi:hypothetical protein